MKYPTSVYVCPYPSGTNVRGPFSVCTVTNILQYVLIPFFYFITKWSEMPASVHFIYCIHHIVCAIVDMQNMFTFYRTSNFPVNIPKKIALLIKSIKLIFKNPSCFFQAGAGQIQSSHHSWTWSWLAPLDKEILKPSESGKFPSFQVDLLQFSFTQCPVYDWDYCFLFVGFFYWTFSQNKNFKFNDESEVWTRFWWMWQKW